MRTNPFRGLGVAVVTPFDKAGNIDFDALGRLIDEQIEGKVDFLCILGTTAETPCLTACEKQSIIDFAVARAGGRVPLLLGAGGNFTAAVIDYIQRANLTGIAGLLIVSPYYNKPSQEGLFQHFCAVANATKLPVVLYNVPGRTGMNVSAATTLRVAEACPNVVAVKEASGNISQIEEIIAGAPEGFEVLSGDDGITFELLSLGAAGIISVVGNALPALFADMVHAELGGDYAKALAIHRSLREVYQWIMVDGNPAGIKALLAAQGKIENVLRLPLVPASASTCQNFKDWLAQQ